MNTKNFRFHMPVAVHYGVGIAHNMTGRIRGERVMIVCDPFLYQSGVAEKLGGALEGKTVSYFSGIEPNPSTVSVDACAEAARAAAESGRNDIAALASPDCASLYGLSVLKTSVQNSDNNHTRFICISKDIEVYPGANRISLMLTLPHRPGSLYRMMARFAALGLNLTKLESRPIEGLDFEFMFYFDIEADVCAAPVLGLLGDLDRAPETFNFLGAYSEL